MNARTRTRTATRITAALAATALLAACGDESRASERDVEEHLEVLVVTPDDYLAMTNEEFVAAARRRLDAVRGIVDALRERGAPATEDDALSTALERRLADFERGDASLEDRAALAEDLSDLERRVRAALAGER